MKTANKLKAGDVVDGRTVQAVELKGTEVKVTFRAEGERDSDCGSNVEWYDANEKVS